MKFRKKIFLAGLAVLLLLITAVSTTFAWFSLNDAAWVDDFDLEIYSTDKLLIKNDVSSYKQMLTTSDIVDAINSDRESGQITSLNEISLTSVHSIDGINFFKLQPSYDDMNRKSVSLVEADQNSYLSFSLTFMVEASEHEGQVHPTYNLKFSENEESEGVKKTSFTSNNQTIKLVNELSTKNGVMFKDESLIVNPVNALRLSVVQTSKSANQNNGYIYEITDSNDLGSYACSDVILAEIDRFDVKYSKTYNAAYTYYNSINNDILNPLGYYYDEKDRESSMEYVNNLFNKLRYDFSDSIAKFTYNQETKSYNEVTIKLGLWLEGFDADNLIGLDVSKIKCLLSFTLEEEVNI